MSNDHIARNRDMREALNVVKTPAITQAKRESAIGLLLEWYPRGGTLHLIKRKRTRSGRVIVDGKGFPNDATTINLGVVMADALDRVFSYKENGLICLATELPELFTVTLSQRVYGIGEPRMFDVQWL